MERPRVYSDLPGFPQPEVEEQTLPSRARFSYNPYDTMLAQEELFPQNSETHDTL